MRRWSVIIPVKPAAVGKSRLGQSPEVTRALALDTVAAAIATAEVDVLVVTADAEVAAETVALGGRVIREPAPTGLAAAIAAGLAVADSESPRAVLLGDLPALRTTDLGAALRDAAAHPRAFVPDAEGTGSTLVTARAGLAFTHAFGDGSAQRHRDAGLIELALPATSSLRRDVDLAEQLAAIDPTELGPRTRAALRP